MPQAGAAKTNLVLFIAAIVLLGVYVYKNPTILKSVNLSDSPLKDIQTQVIVDKAAEDIKSQIQDQTEDRVKGIANSYNTVSYVATNQGKNLADYVLEGVRLVVDPETKTSAEVYKAVGDAKMAENKYTEAVENFEKYVAAEPKSVGGYCSLADAYNRAGDKNKALEILQKAIGLLR
ncbi:MAG: hypothetical protein UX44_C0028G0006 [candidate division WWE3 bacterium GW2011_GWA1_46_21]|uniref:Uncharacterized protein n=2 Tax=Katanobacteria TaxID=422282 RepID=A0A0G1PAV3_UNCKA|nr:MAG: hypothetical protein UX44_C0028G0006 [candidate division WWE3 bacterium GW2011_GWA1_46_21]KKU50580.1 MAG: hypothetical protein UX73_C0020G0005 [candidate division WWE3 bacterium GW2011_GWC1_47_10]